MFQLSTFNYFPINLGSTREQGPYLTSNFRLAGLLTVGIFLSNSLFLIAILHRDLRNCFVFSISVHLLSIFYLDFYFSFLFGLLSPFSIWTFFSLFYLDFYFSFLFGLLFPFSICTFISLFYFDFYFPFLFGPLFPLSIWTFISLFYLDFYFPFIFGLLFPFSIWNFISFCFLFSIRSNLVNLIKSDQIRANQTNQIRPN